jgi:hypothetical protein
MQTVLAPLGVNDKNILGGICERQRILYNV